MENNGKVLTALLLGAIGGAVAGLLLAPESGTKTRSKLGKTAEDLINDLEEIWEEGSEKIKEMADEVVNEVEKPSQQEKE